MQLKKCSTCMRYTLLDTCSVCGVEVDDISYKFKQIRDAPKDSAQHFAKIRSKKK